VSTRSVASCSTTIEIISDSEDNVVNGKTKVKEETNGMKDDHCQAGSSSVSPPPSSPPNKKKRVSFPRGIN